MRPAAISAKHTSLATDAVEPQCGACGRLYRGVRLGWHLRRFARQEAGSYLIEVAIVLPVYFLFIFGLFSFSIVLFAYANASFASTAAARYGATHSTTSLLPCSSSTIQGLVRPYLWGAPSSGATVTTTWNPSNTIGSTVSVNVKMTYQTGLPYVGLKNLMVSTTATEIIIH